MPTLFGLKMGSVIFRITQAKSGKLNWSTLSKVTRKVKGQERTEKVSGPGYDTLQACTYGAIKFGTNLGLPIDQIEQVEIPANSRKREKDPAVLAAAAALCEGHAAKEAQDALRPAAAKAKKAKK